jgi:hypothetical protein
MSAFAPGRTNLSREGLSVLLLRQPGFPAAGFYLMQTVNGEKDDRRMPRGDRIV